MRFETSQLLERRVQEPLTAENAEHRRVSNHKILCALGALCGEGLWDAQRD
jgi:hypothetical protein